MRTGSRIFFQKDIEQRFAVGRSTVTNLIQLMEKKGFVKRESVKQDARLKKGNPDRKTGLQARNLLKILWSISKKSFPKEYQKKNFIFFDKVLDRINQNVKKYEVR